MTMSDTDNKSLKPPDTEYSVPSNDIIRSGLSSVQYKGMPNLSAKAQP